jgi:ATP-binding cassette subfamily C (CFTR/MRP) protein 1
MNVSRTFTSLSLLVIMSKPLSQLFQLIPMFIAALGCLKRVQTFLVAPSQVDHRLRSSLQDNDSTSGVDSSNEQIELRHRKAFTGTTSKINNDYIFMVHNAAFGWPGSEPVLRDISLAILRSKLTMIIGPVASGKSTLCKALLGEAIIFRGSVQFNDEARLSQIAYCDQSPFLFNTSLRENILGFSAFDSAWYDIVVDAVGLTDDFKALPSGDNTSVGSNGASLSGGQRQRVAIARAIYSKKQTVFFDDIMSGLDTNTEQLIFDKLLGSEGLLQRQGRTIVFFTHATKFLPAADQIIILEKMGKVEQGTFHSLSKTSTYLQKAISVLSSPRTSTPDAINSAINSATIPTAPSRAAEKFFGPSRQQGDSKIYKYYFKAVGTRNSMILFVFGICLGFSSAFPTAWLSFWSDADTQDFDVNGRYLGIYALLQVLGLVIFGGYLYHCLNTIAANSGLRLHRTALQAVMSASTAWLSRTDTGLTTNRFSQDMELIDGELPQALMNLIMTMFTILGQAILITIATPYVAVSFPALLAVLFFIQRFYLRTSRQLRILDLETKSPL